MSKENVEPAELDCLSINFCVGWSAGSKGSAKTSALMFPQREMGAITVAQTPNLALTGQGNGAMKTFTLAALAVSLCAASPAYAEKPTDPQTELIVNLSVITASVDRCHFEIDSRIIGLVLLKELILIEDTLPNGRVHYNMAVGLRVAANAVQGAYDEDPGEWCESTWRNYGPDGVTKKGWIMRRGAP